jgi:hypothetical protein
MDSDDWLHKLLEEERPEGWRMFRQPGGVLWDGQSWVPNPAAENLGNLPAGYYQRQLAGQSHDWIQIYLANEPGFVIDGRPVYPEFFDSVPVAPQPLAPVINAPVIIGLDFGLTPSAVFCQRTARGQWLVLAELVSEDMGVTRFAELLAAHIAAWFPGVECVAWGDPAGAARSPTEERTCLEIVRTVAKIRCLAAQQLHAAARGGGSAAGAPGRRQARTAALAGLQGAAEGLRRRLPLPSREGHRRRALSRHAGQERLQPPARRAAVRAQWRRRGSCPHRPACGVQRAADHGTDRL